MSNRQGGSLRLLVATRACLVAREEVVHGGASDCRVRHGSGDVLVVAPHAALGSGDGPRRQANDFHTEAVAAAIAARVDGSLVVNHAIDRELLDLNRRSVVEQRAPWFAELLRDALARILARHPTASVLFVHGWHVMQPRCDVGVGARLEDARAASSRADSLTASPAWLEARIDALRRTCSRLGVRVTYGERWPAAHPNNLLQVFRRTPRAASCAALAELTEHAARGRIEAAQLELGAPLRWPGALRDEFVTACVAALRQEGAPPPTPVEPHRRKESVVEEGFAGRIGVQVYDLRAGRRGLGIIAGVAHLPGGDTGARLLLFPGGSRLAVFVGHERGHGALAVEGLRFAGSDAEWTLAFDGHVLLAEDGRRYFADEREQVAARLGRATVQLSFRSPGGAGIGRATGEVRLDGERFSIDASGFSSPLPLALRQTPHATRIYASFVDGQALLADTASESIAFVSGQPRPLPRAAAAFLGSGAFALDVGAGGTVECRPQSRIDVWRPSPAGRAVRVSFGTARFVWGGDRQGAGFYERAEPDSAALPEDPEQRRV